MPSNKTVIEIEMPLRNYHTDPHIARGGGLDIDGFTLVKHQSSLTTEEEWLNEQRIMDVYVPEVIDLVKQNTGAKQVFVNNVCYRRKLVEKQLDSVLLKGNPLDQHIKSLPTDRFQIGPKAADASMEPARGVHVDFTIDSMLNAVRYNRREIFEAGKSILEEIDQCKQRSAPCIDIKGRIAAYTVWRPLKPVHRDPLAVAKYRSVPKSDFCASEYRHPGDIPEDKEYLSAAYMIRPPTDPGRQMWYWVPEQKSDEVWLVKFADTAAAAATIGTQNGDLGVEEWAEGIATATPHCSPALKDVGNDAEPRESIEVRVLAFW